MYTCVGNGKSPTTKNYDVHGHTYIHLSSVNMLAEMHAYCIEGEGSVHS